MQLIRRCIVRTALLLHNYTYYLAGKYSQLCEPNRLHPKHRLTDYHLWFIGNVREDWQVLDAGCGNGALTAEVYRYCKSITGIDISPVNINKAKSHSGPKFICADVTTYPFEGKFDAVMLSNVLEHINNRIDFLIRLSQISNRLLVRVPMVDRDWITLYKKEMGIEYRLDPTHFIEYTLADFKEEMGKAGWEIESSRIRYGELYALVILKK